MKQEDMQQYKVATPTIFTNTWRFGDGYDLMQAVSYRGWYPIDSWGRDHGYNLGSWPLVIIFTRYNPVWPEAPYELAYYVEGDVEVYSCPTQEIRDSIIDELAFFHWKCQGEEWVKDVETVEALPEALRGPYQDRVTLPSE